MAFTATSSFAPLRSAPLLISARMAFALSLIHIYGYSGNIMLKSIEGTGKLLSIKLKDMLMHSTGTKLAALLLKGQDVYKRQPW